MLLEPWKWGHLGKTKGGSQNWEDKWLPLISSWGLQNQCEPAPHFCCLSTPKCIYCVTERKDWRTQRSEVGTEKLCPHKCRWGPTTPWTRPLPTPTSSTQTAFAAPVSTLLYNKSHPNQNGHLEFLFSDTDVIYHLELSPHKIARAMAFNMCTCLQRHCPFHCVWNADISEESINLPNKNRHKLLTFYFSSLTYKLLKKKKKDPMTFDLFTKSPRPKK